MKVFQILSCATLALAAPSAMAPTLATTEQKTIPIITTLTAIIANLQNITVPDLSHIQSAVQTIKNTKNATTINNATNQINTNYKAIAAALQAAVSQISGSNTGIGGLACGGLLGGGSSSSGSTGSSSNPLSGLSQAQITQAATAVDKATSFLDSILSSITSTSSTNIGAAGNSVSVQSNSVESLTTSFAVPVLGLSADIAASSTSPTTVAGLKQALSTYFDTLGQLTAAGLF
ncbi:hypothetical protein SCAR479_10025 [Seiridium cardinale]|uniref:Uncharacterized protein n=1 Tax=Seiridium cardinale TaxID=138064 RepID=A0ABR2XHM3_9PEZI